MKPVPEPASETLPLLVTDTVTVPAAWGGATAAIRVQE